MHRSVRAGTRLAVLGVLTASCHGNQDATAAIADSGVDATGTPDTSVDVGAADAPAVRPAPVAALGVTTRVQTRELLFAAGEMQISGEPFARDFMGRNLDNYDRFHLPTDQYSPAGTASDWITDIVGFSTAVESYEYSKYHQNMIAFETYAGPSLAWGPVLNAAKDTASDEPTVRKRLSTRIGQLIINAGTDVAGYALVPPPTTNPLNVLGFSGLHPILAPYRSFDPTLNPDNLVARNCTAGAGYVVASIGTHVPDYECGYASLQLVDRAKQLDFAISPGTIGLAAWKYSLWSIDFLSRLHDFTGAFVLKVDPADEPTVGKVDNKVVGADDTGAPTSAGTFIGSTGLEGMWGLVMMEEMNNAAQWLLTDLVTADGTTPSGFATLKDALTYDYTSSPRWWPTTFNVVEAGPAAWPSATTSIADGTSHAEDLANLLLGHAMLFGMTDPRNTGLGGSLGLRLTFDGDPFVADDGTPNGEPTAHDRALAILRVAFIDLDRFHGNNAGVVVDEAKPASKAGDALGTRATTTTLAHVLIGLRQTVLSLNAAITQYGGADPSPKLDDKGILNSIAIHAPTGAATFSARVRAVLVKQAEFVRDVVTAPDGSVANFVTFNADGTPTRDPAPTTIEAQTSAIRALLEGFLTTGDASYVERARACFRKLESEFWMPSLRFYRGVRGGDDSVGMTAERFTWLQSAVRELHKTAHVPGDALLSRTHLEERMGRINKLFLNGWDDVNGDQKVDLATECLAARMQLGEQSLTGELGKDPTGVLAADRDSDCVMNISAAKLGSVLAGEVKFSAK